MRTTLLSVILILFGITLSLFAQVASVEYVKGNAFVYREGKKKTIKTGMEIREAETVETKKGATIIVRYEDGSKIKINERSKAEIIEAKQEKKSLSLLLGSVFALVLKQEEKSSFTIETPTAIAAVRGTQFFMGYGKGDKSAPDLWLCVNEGSVHVTSEKEKEGVSVNEGEGIFILKGRDITEPKPYEWTKGLNWNMDVDAGEIENENVLDDAYNDILDIDYD